MASAIYISDMSKCEPATALSRAPKQGSWRMVDYETEEGVKGIMLFAAPEDRAPEITLSLHVVGPHKIYVGINYTRSSFGDTLHHTEWSLYGTTWIKLSKDEGFSRFTPEIWWRHAVGRFPSKTGKETSIWHSIHETYWKTADLTGQSIKVRPPGPPYDAGELASIANISYVKLVPLSNEEVTAYKRLEPTEDTRCVAILFCTGELTGHTMGNPMYHPTDEQWLRDEFAPFFNNDVGIISFEAIRGNLCTFRTTIGDVGTEDNSWPQEWLDPLETATKIAHEHGIRLFVSMRMIGASLPVVRNPIQWARFYWRNQQWAKRSPDGLPTSGMSLAFPEVRTYWISLLREGLERGCDGVQLHLNRSSPFVLYEQPSVDAFRERYGEDPCNVPQDDPRWLQHSADYVTQLVREVRAMLDERPGRSLAVTVFCGSYEPGQYLDPFAKFCDVDTWIKENLVDYLMPSPSVSPEQIEHWKKLSTGKVHVWPDLMPRTQPGEHYVALAKQYYDARADGLCLWDGERRPPRCSEWAVARHLGHRALLDDLASEAPLYFRTVRLRMLNGMAVKYSFTDG